MDASPLVEERVGRLAVFSRAHEHGSSYRDAALAPILELKLAAAKAPNRPRVRLVGLLILVLSIILLIFALVTRSGPAIGTVSIALAAMAWLVLAGRRMRSSTLRIQNGELALLDHTAGYRLPLLQIESAGVGQDTEGLATLFVRVRDRGRVLVFDGLSTEEAELAARCLREALR